MKGVDIVVHGSIGHVGAFMAQTGQRWSSAATPATTSATRSTRPGSTSAARSASLGADCIEKEMGDEHRAELAELLRRAEADADPAEFRRYGSARQLYNFQVDNAGAY